MEIDYADFEKGANLKSDFKGAGRSVYAGGEKVTTKADIGRYSDL